VSGRSQSVVARTPGAEVVFNRMRNPEYEASAHSLNFCEVYYDFVRASDESVASDAVNDLLVLGIKERNDMHHSWRAMGQLKAIYKRVSLADCAASHSRSIWTRSC